MIDKFVFFSYPEDNHISAVDRLFEKLQIDNDRKGEFDREFVTLYQTHIRRMFPTLRRAKRYLNALTPLCPPLRTRLTCRIF